MMKGNSHHSSDKSRQDAELRAMGLSPDGSNGWQDVGMITALVVIVGIVLTSFLNLSPLLWKASIAGFLALGLGIGLWARKRIIDVKEKRLVDSKRNAASAREEETQRQLAEMRQKKMQEVDKKS